MRVYIKVVLIGLVLLSGCQPKPSTSDLVKNMTVTTEIVNSPDFTKFSTYYLSPDTIKYFNSSSDYYPDDSLQCTSCNANGKTPYRDYWMDYPTQLTTKFAQKLNAAGYTSVGQKQNPDLIAYIVIVENYNVYQTYNYYPYGYGYYGYYNYGGYYPSVNVSDQADLYLVLFDAHRLTSGQPTLIWKCDIGDLVSSPDFVTLSLSAIDRAFAQSTYIHK